MKLRDGDSVGSVLIEPISRLTESHFFQNLESEPHPLSVWFLEEPIGPNRKVLRFHQRNRMREHRRGELDSSLVGESNAVERAAVSSSPARERAAQRGESSSLVVASVGESNGVGVLREFSWERKISQCTYIIMGCLSYLLMLYIYLIR